MSRSTPIFSFALPMTEMPSPASATLFATDADRWRAVQQRNTAADGIFVYAVRTTRIYCRPNCKARLARRANVAFFAGPAAAEGAGFRACKRCKPRTSGVMPEDDAVMRIREMLQKEKDATERVAGDGTLSRTDSSSTLAASHADCSPSALASQAGVSRWHFHRKFKEVTGLTPLAYLQRQRAAQKRTVGSSTEPEACGNDSGQTRDWNGQDQGADAALGMDTGLFAMLSSWDGTLPAGNSDLDSYFAEIDIDLLAMDASAWDMGILDNDEFGQNLVSEQPLPDGFGLETLLPTGEPR